MQMQLTTATTAGAAMIEALQLSRPLFRCESSAIATNASASTRNRNFRGCLAFRRLAVKFGLFDVVGSASQVAFALFCFYLFAVCLAVGAPQRDAFRSVFSAVLPKILPVVSAPLFAIDGSLKESFLAVLSIVFSRLLLNFSAMAFVVALSALAGLLFMRALPRSSALASLLLEIFIRPVCTMIFPRVVSALCAMLLVVPVSILSQLVRVFPIVVRRRHTGAILTDFRKEQHCGPITD